MSIEDYGWNDRFQSLFNHLCDGDLIPARVTRVDRGAVTAEMNLGRIVASTAGTLSEEGEPGPAAVGDWVAIDHHEDTALIRAILPRTGALSRRRPGEADHQQVVAANVDIVLVVESLERGPNARRIERATALAWDGGASPIVVLTKMDLCPDLESSLATARGGAPFCEVLALSSTTGDGVDDLKSRLAPGTTSVLLGPSGVGKSTLTNRLLGEEKFAVAEVRTGDSKGRHTTTFREMVAIPGGACLIDTPGVRELGLWLDAEAVANAFPEIEASAQGCRFGDCRHESEPGCAVLEAVEQGSIDAKRLESFVRLRREAENLDLRRDASRRYEARAKERGFGKMIRQALKVKKDR